MKLRKIIFAVAGMTALCGIANTYASEPYPSHPIRVVVPFPPGGTSDSVARLLAKGMGDRLGQPVIVENKGGGGTIIGTDSVARSAPDGYTLLWMTPPFAINHTLYKKLPYKTLEDIAVVADIVEVPLVLIVRSDSELQSVAQIVDVSRKEPGKLTYASSGIGGTPHLATSMFASAKNIAFTHVPYQGSSPAVMAMLGGQTDMVFDTLFLTYPQVTAGKARALAQTGSQRSELLPNVPTMAEAGLPGYEATSWMSLGAPSGTPASILKRLSEAARDTVASTSFSRPLVQQGVVMVKRNQADAQARVTQEVAKWGDIVRQSGATAQ